MAAQSRSPLSNLARTVLALTFLLAVWLRFANLSATALGYEEIGHALIAQRSWWRAVTALAAQAGDAPLNYLITHFMLMLGRSELLLRMPAALAGMGSVALVFWLARRLFGLEAALLAAFTLAIVPLHVRSSQELRFYSLATLMALASVCAFWLAQESNTKGAWTRFAVVHAVGLYTHYYLLFVGVALLLWVLICRRQVLWNFIAAAGAATLLFVPWLYYDNVVHGGQSLGPAAAQLRVPGGLSKIAIGPFVEVAAGRRDLSYLPKTLWVYVYTVWEFTVLGLIASVFHRERKALLLVTLPTVVGIPGLLALDWYWNQTFIGRQSLIFLPFLVLAMAGVFALAAGRFVKMRPARATVLALVGAVSVLVLWPWLPSLSPSAASTGEKPLVRLDHLLNALVAETDIIVVGYPDRLAFYVRGLRKQMIHGRTARLDDQINGMVTESGVVWIVGWGPNVGPRLVQWAKEHEARDLSALVEMPLFVYAPDNPDIVLERGLLAVNKPSLAAAESQALRVALAKQLLGKDRIDEALALIEPIEDWSKLDANSLATLGAMYMAGPAANWPNAKDVYTLLLEKNPNHWQAHQDLGRIALSAKDWKRVIELGEHILPYTENSEGRRAATLRQLFRAYGELGDTARLCVLWPDVVAKANESVPFQLVIRDFGERIAGWCGAEAAATRLGLLAAGETVVERGDGRGDAPNAVGDAVRAGRGEPVASAAALGYLFGRGQRSELGRSQPYLVAGLRQPNRPDARIETGFHVGHSIAHRGDRRRRVDA
jgi:hypothetical protein